MGIGGIFLIEIGFVGIDILGVRWCFCVRLR